MNSNDDALLMILERNQFYRRQYLLGLGAFGMALLVIITLIFVLFYVIRNPAAPLYFATDNVGRLIKVVPVTEPNMSTEAASQWAIRAVEQTYSYDYVNYRRQLQSVQKYFTTYGWTKFMSALTASNNLVALTNRKMLIQARVVGEPKVIAQGLLGGSYAWKFEMPVLVTNYLPPYDAQSTFSNALVVTIIVQRMPILQSNDGVGIVQLVASMSAAPAAPGSTMSRTPAG